MGIDYARLIINRFRERHVVGTSTVLAETVDRVVIINEGRLRFAGPLEDLGHLEAAFLRLTAAREQSPLDRP
jgi:hypothetical protein